MADQKLIDITDLLRQEQEKTTSELITTRHSIQEMSNGIVERLSLLPSKEEIQESSNVQQISFQEMSDKIAEGLSFLPSKEESQGMSDVQSIEYSLELANVRDDLRDGFQSVVDAVNGLSVILDDIEKNTFSVMDKEMQIFQAQDTALDEHNERVKEETEESNSISSDIKETLVSRLPSKESQEEEENESDKQHEELVDALEGGSGGDSGTKKKGGLLGGLMSGIGSIGKGLAKPLKGLFGFLGSIGKIFKSVGGFGRC